MANMSIASGIIEVLTWSGTPLSKGRIRAQLIARGIAYKPYQDDEGDWCGLSQLDLDVILERLCIAGKIRPTGKGINGSAWELVQNE